MHFHVNSWKPLLFRRSPHKANNFKSIASNGGLLFEAGGVNDAVEFNCKSPFLVQRFCFAHSSS